MELEIKVFVNDNVAASNCYVLSRNEKCFVIDPGSYNMSEVIEYIKDEGLELEGILQTHGHYDHILGIPNIVEYKKVPVYISEKGYDFLYNPELSLSVYGYKNFVISKEIEVKKIKENDEIFGFKILETPGHSIGDICYFDEENGVLFSGDTMFKGTYGRVDLPTSNSTDMWKSLQKLILLPNSTMVYPGHGDVTTIGIERNLYTY